MRLTKLSLIFILFICISFYCKGINHPKREFRAVWIATVSNIDWPSKPNLSVRKQKSEFISIIESHKQLGINAVVVQVRPSADALYKSELEPWSEWLTGQQGKAPSPYYDPLEFMIEECHKRAIEFHAWFNPFRLSNSVKKKLAPSHIAEEKPEWVVTYGSKKILNPGIPEARKYVQKVVQDVVKRYDIDGVHFDDYFYPYPKKDLIFDDYKAFQSFNSNDMNQDDWRRENINNFIKEMYQLIKETKPFVKFGISPFGIWRNKSDDTLGSETSGLPSYDAIYADSRKWLEEGWLDYITPQLYWSMDFKAASYRKLLNWWSQNTFGKHLYAGHAVYKINNNYDKAWNDPAELQRQIVLNREIDGVHGSVFFSSSKLLKNPSDIQDSIKNNLYVYPALSPTMKWKDSYPPESPQKIKTVVSENGNIIKWNRAKKAVDGDQPSYYVLYRFDELESIKSDDPSRILAILPASQKNYLDQTAQSEIVYNYGISALDRLQNESTLLTLFQKQTIDTEIKEITVYPTLAHIKRASAITLDAGLTQLTFTNLSTKINPESIVCLANNNVSVKDIKYTDYYPSANSFKKETDSLTRVIKLYNDYLGDIKTSINILDTQQDKLIKDRSIIKNQVINIRNLKRAREKLEEQLKEIKKLKAVKFNESDSLLLIIDSLDQKVFEYETLRSKKAGKVIVNLYSKTAVNTNIKLNYSVKDVSWKPEFNLNMNNWGQPITLDYKLKVFQNTEIDWEQIPITFTNKSLVKTFQKKQGKKLIFKVEKRRKGDISSEEIFNDQFPNKTVSPYVDISFDNPQTIFSDSSDQQFLFRSSPLKTDFEYLINAEKSSTAFSIARLSNWKAYKLTKGIMNLYINNTFSGSSNFIPDISSDTLDLILGTDEDIIINKKLKYSKTTVKYASIFKKVQRDFQLFIVNNKSKDVKIKVEEYIPLSNDNRLKIIVSSPNAVYNPKTGIVTWNLELKSGESSTLDYNYLIKHPKWTKVILE